MLLKETGGHLTEVGYIFLRLVSVRTNKKLQNTCKYLEMTGAPERESNSVFSP